MCTVITKENLIGRTLDYECSFGEQLVILPKGYSFELIHEGTICAKNQIMGICHMAEGVPLFYEGINDRGVGAYALNFPRYACYNKVTEGKLNLASFEVIGYILSVASSLEEALNMLSNLNITDDSFSDNLPPTTMHWLIADREGSAVIEPLASGVKICKNPIGVLTNSPPLEYHLTRLSEIASLHPGAPENRLIKNAKGTHYSRGMGAMGLPGDFSSGSRFLRAAFVKENTITGKEGEVESLFHIMDSVAVPLGCSETENGEPVSTIYTSVSDLDRGMYYYTTYKSRKIRCISLNMGLIDGVKIFDF